jgi:DNA-binding NarL/FixJ family response regulator
LKSLWLNLFMMNKSILLIDDHAMFRSGMRLLLLAGMDHVQVMEASSLEQALHLTLQAPDVILLDIQLQGVNGLQGMGMVKRQWPEVPVVMLSSVNDADTVRLCMERGAVAFVSKADTDKKIIRIIQQIFSNPQSEEDMSLPARHELRTLVNPQLTPRQCEVLDLLCEGLSNRAIAERMQVSEYTVRGHVQHLLTVLGVNSRAAALFKARKLGLIA